MVVKLQTLCPAGCEELDDLRNDVAEAEAKGAAKSN